MPPVARLVDSDLVEVSDDGTVVCGQMCVPVDGTLEDSFSLLGGVVLGM
jgi:hypothetical protein